MHASHYYRDSASSYASTSELQSNRNSGSDILVVSQLDESSRCSSASPLCHSQVHESSYQQEMESDVVVPIEETNMDEANSNATQQVVPHAGSRP